MYSVLGLVDDGLEIQRPPNGYSTRKCHAWIDLLQHDDDLFKFRQDGAIHSAFGIVRSVLYSVSEVGSAQKKQVTCTPARDVEHEKPWI